MNINIYNPYVRRELELYHHGIEGQKWGKRNGPPYPLSKEDYSAAEKKAKGYTKKLNDMYKGRDKIAESTLKKEIKADKIADKYDKEISRNGNSKKAKELKEKHDLYVKDVELSADEMAKIDEEVERISDQLADEGFTITRADGIKQVAIGRNIAAQIFSGGLFGNGVTGQYDTSRFVVDFDPEDIAEAQKERSGNKSTKSEKESKNERERFGSYEVEWDEDTGEIKSVKDSKGNRASLDDVFEEQERNERKSKNDEKLERRKVMTNDGSDLYMDVDPKTNIVKYFIDHEGNKYEAEEWTDLSKPDSKKIPIEGPKAERLAKSKKSTKSEKKPKIQIPAENSNVMKRMRAKIEDHGVESLTDKDWEALGWTDDIVGTDEEIELLNRLHL